MNRFKKYKELKESFDFVYKGIHLNRALSDYLYQTLNLHHNPKLKHLGSVLKYYDVSYFEFDPSKHKVLSTFGVYTRKDHYELYKQVTIRMGKEVAQNRLNSLKCTCFPILKIIKCFFKMMPYLAKLPYYSFMQKAHLFAETMKYVNTIDVIYQVGFNDVKTFLCQCHVLDIENILTQYFKLRQVPTYSLAEGVYMIFNVNSDDAVIGYENFETDHLLVWGQYSKDQYINWGIPAERMTVAGYPKIVDIKHLKGNNPFKKCMVLLARHSFVDSNMDLLRLLSEYVGKYEFHIKPHPAAVEYYDKVAKQYGMYTIPSNETINNCLSQDKFDWCIAVNTTAYYEAWMRGIPCLRFYDGKFDVSHGFDDLFGDKKQFEDAVNQFSSPSSDFQKDVDDMLEYAIGLGIDRYKEIINPD